MPPRFKREDCWRTKHDSVFSHWEILIGANDWENHSLGKDGIERYRIHNLPIRCSCPGVYELGVAAILTDGSRNSRKHRSDDIVVVYLGQADNVRTRLQHYGRAGSHLDHGNPLTFSSKSGNSCLQRGPGLFKEVFSRGYSIMFRWAPMMNKEKAEKTEAQLLSVFDYAWNTRGNGACRREDILLKLDNSISSSLLRKLQAWKLPVFVRKVGIKINSNKYLDECASSSYLEGFLIPQIHKIIKTRPRSIEWNDNLYGAHDFCGVSIGDGSVCKNRPISGRKRCAQHKGKRINGANSVTGCIITSKRSHSSVCGVGMEDGSICMESPAHGRMRCELHRVRRIAESEPHKLPEEKTLNQVGLLFNNNCPFEDQQRWRPKGTKPVISEEGRGMKGTYDIEEEHNICAFINEDGYVCRRKPVLGRKRCPEHKGKRIVVTRLILSSQEKKDVHNIKEKINGANLVTGCIVTSERSHSSVCGVGMEDGSICIESSDHGRMRCELHRVRRIAESEPHKLPEEKILNQVGLLFNNNCPFEDHQRQRPKGTKPAISKEGRGMKRTYDIEEHNICAFISEDGYVCRRKPVLGRKRCQEHKGKRIVGT